MKISLQLVIINLMLWSFSNVNAAANAANARPKRQAVVIVSGGAAVTPFTTPSRGCRSGYSAGNTDTFLREYLLDKGFNVFTSPAMAGFGQVPAAGDSFIGPFDDCQKALPQYMTVNSVGDIQLAGVSLANFINYLGKKYHIKQVDLVAHSMGGLYSTSAIKYLRDTRSKVKVRSLTAIGSPWQGTPFANPMDANDKFSGCDGQLACINLIKVFGNAAPVVLVELERKQRDALNNYNAGVLDDIPVTLIAGNAFAKKMGI